MVSYFGFAPGDRVTHGEDYLGTVVEPAQGVSDVMLERKCVPVIWDINQKTGMISWIISKNLIKVRIDDVGVVSMSACSFIKKEWMKLPEPCFAPLTFGEIKVGEKFIALPAPGDNEGQGGLRTTYNIFTKTNSGEATNNQGKKSIIHDTMFIVRIQ